MMSERNFFTHQQPTKRLKAYVAYCRTCGCPWLVLPASERAVRADTLSAQEAKACGIDIADALREHVDELKKRSLCRSLRSAFARVAAWLCREATSYNVLGRWKYRRAR